VPVDRLERYCMDGQLLGHWWSVRQGTRSYLALFDWNVNEAQVRACLENSLDSDLDCPIAVQDLPTFH
jgi:hypothetical protein